MVQKGLRLTREFSIMTFGIALSALGWTGFLIPHLIPGGGISGISALIFYSTTFPIGLSYFLFNIVIIYAGIKALGRNFGVRTVFGIIAYSVILQSLQPLFPEPIVKETFMAVLIGAVLNGAGVALVFMQGGSVGGTGTIALIINKFKNSSPGKLLLYMDLVIIAFSFLVFQSIEKLLYGFVVMAITSYTLDLLLEGSKQSVQIFIFSKHYDAIAEQISSQLNRGVTIMEGTGWYSKEKVPVLIIFIRKDESPNVMRIVKETDPMAFMSMNSVMGLWGKGFDQFKKA